MHVSASFSVWRCFMTLRAPCSWPLLVSSHNSSALNLLQYSLPSAVCSCNCIPLLLDTCAWVCALGVSQCQQLELPCITAPRPNIYYASRVLSRDIRESTRCALPAVWRSKVLITAGATTKIAHFSNFFEVYRLQVAYSLYLSFRALRYFIFSL